MDTFCRRVELVSRKNRKELVNLKRLNDKPNLIRIVEGWGVFCLLGIVMLNYPFLHIFNKPQDIFGIPLMVLYLFIGWPISIFVIFLFSRYLVSSEDSERSAKETEEEAE